MCMDLHAIKRFPHELAGQANEVLQCLQAQAGGGAHTVFDARQDAISTLRL